MKKTLYKRKNKSYIWEGGKMYLTMAENLLSLGRRKNVLYNFENVSGR